MNAPNTRLNASVSHKWLRATVAGIKGFGSSRAVVQDARNAAVAVAYCHRAIGSVRSSGYTHPIQSSARNT